MQKYDTEDVVNMQISLADLKVALQLKEIELARSKATLDLVDKRFAAPEVNHFNYFNVATNVYRWIHAIIIGPLEGPISLFIVSAMVSLIIFPGIYLLLPNNGQAFSGWINGNLILFFISICFVLLVVVRFFRTIYRGFYKVRVSVLEKQIDVLRSHYNEGLIIYSNMGKAA